MNPLLAERRAAADALAANAARVAAEGDAPPPLDLTVILVSWNTRDLLRDCLASLLTGGGLEGIASFAIRVVDNASDDGSAAMVAAEFPGVHLTASRHNRGFARANNQAIAEATPSRYLLLLNPDTVVPPGALARLVAAMDARPDAAVASPLLRNADGSPQFCWARFPGLGSELSGKLDLRQSPYPLADYADPARRERMQPFIADWVGGACFLVRTSTIAYVGPLDPGFFMYGEETDWCRRFRQVGGVTLLVPSVTVTHLGGQSSRRVPVATRAHLYESSARLYRLLYGPVMSLLPIAVAGARYHLFRRKQQQSQRGEQQAQNEPLAKAASER